MREISFATKIVVATTILGLALGLATVCYYVWELHFWIPAGRAFAIGNWKYGDYEFQVWQRKTRYVTEPFADGLFVRRGTNAWEAFCFDIQDNFRPTVQLTNLNGKIEVLRSGENRGEYDISEGVFRRHNQVYDPDPIRGDPPGNWWLRD